MEIDLKLIENVCNEHRNLNIFGLYLLDNIPEKKLNNAIEYFPLTGAKRIFMLYDSSVFGSCKTGIAMCNNGFFYKNGITVQPKYKHFSWDEFATIEIFADKDYMFFGKENKFFMLNSLTKNSDSYINFLKKIQQSILYADKCTENVVNNINHENKLEKTDAWMLDVDGKKYGPMNKKEINENIKSNLIIPERTLVWNKDTCNWEPFERISELKAILKEASKYSDSKQTKSVTEAKIVEENPKIDINNCELDELLEIDCISMEMANYLIEMRSKGRKFYDSDDIGAILDLKPHEVEEIKNKIAFNYTRNLKTVRRVDF